MTITSYVDKMSKGLKLGLKGNAAARTVALRIMSDFISSRSGLKAATDSGNFSKASARPDQQGSFNAFLKAYGVELQRTSITGGAQVYAELKQKTAQDRQVTITSLALTRNSDEESAFLKSFELQRGFKEEDVETLVGKKINQLTSSELHDWVDNVDSLKESLIRQVEEKFENFILIDYLDKRHNSKASIKVLPGASKKLNLRINFRQSVDLSARQTRRSEGKVAVTLEAKLSNTAYDRFLDQAIDATNKFHESLGANFNTRFLKYAVSQFSAKSKVSAEDFLTAIISISKEFQEGSQTPIIYETVIKKLEQGISNQTIELINDIPTKKGTRKETPQKFISNAQITALVQKEVEKRMPKGPLRGPPLSPTVLTYRTGTFVNSIELIQDFRENLIKYYYAPNYKIHERKGARAPRFLLQASIRATVQKLYSEKFRIIRGF
jgi:hypothetical protein